MTFDTCDTCAGAKQVDGKVCTECRGLGAVMMSCFMPGDGSPRPEARPFLKWTGGKTKLLPQLLERAPKEFVTYFEPFLGGGALFFALKPEQACLSDMNEDLIETFRVVRDDPEGLMFRLDRVLESHAKDPAGFYQSMRAAVGRRAGVDAPVVAAARFVYLNKTGFNGLWRVNKSGKNNVPIGTNGRKTDPKVYDREELLAASKALRYAKLDAYGYLKATALAQPGDFVYLDPPYAPLSATANFTGYTPGGFGPADQVALRDEALRLKRLGVHVLLSNSSAPLIRDLYKGSDWTVEEVDVQRSNGVAKGRGVVKELLIS